jgi:predicted ATPase
VTYGKPSAASTLRGKVPTGYGRLDGALRGGFFAGSAILLSAPASSEVPILVRNFLKASSEVGLLVCRSQSSAESVSRPDDADLKCMICSEKPIPPSKNMVPGKGIDNLTELNFQITETIGSIQPKHIVLEILSDILLRHRALQTRKWLNEFLEKLRSKGITTLAVLNPYMHPNEEVQAVVDLFDGNLDIVEKEVEGQLQKFLRIKWIQGLEVAENELPLLDLTPERLEASRQPAVVTHFREPRWLTSLVGRTTELSKLKASFENALGNKSSVVTLQGEAGVGKTRLMQELGVYAQSKEGTVLTGSASEAGLPYAPWIDATRQYVAQAPGELLHRMLGPYASELVKLVPDIAVKLGTIPPSKPLGEQQDKIRFYEAATQFFISICSESPLLLLFDDMHLVDQSSLELLEYFVRSSSNFRVLTACSYRPEHVQPDSPFYQTLMKFNRQHLLETIQVKNLSEEETTELITQTFGEQTISSEFADLVYQTTAGNPYFVEEVLRSLVEDGTIFRTETKWDRKPIQEIIVPQSVKSTLRSRLTKLDPVVVSTLQLAAVTGSEFQFEVLLEVSQMSEDTLFKALEAAISQGLLVEVPHEKGGFRFADNRIRELLLDDLIQVKRARYHVKIAEAMEKVYSKKLDKQAEFIATHFSEGGDAERTIKYSLMAGDRNRTIHAYEQAIADYKRALDLIELEGGREEEKAVIYEKLGQFYLYAGHNQESIQSFQQAVTIFEKLHDFKSCARISVEFSWPVMLAKGFRDAILVLRQALKYVEETPESCEAAGIYSELANVLGVVDEFDEANSWCKRALEAGEKSGNYEAVSSALLIMGTNLTDTGRIDEGLPLLEKSVKIAQQHGEPFLHLFNAFVNLSAYTYPRNLSKAREFASRQLALAKSENVLFLQAGSQALLSRLDWLSGNWTLALKEITEAFELQERVGFKFVYGGASHPEACRGLIHLDLGDLEQAEKYLQAAAVKQYEKITPTVEAHLRLAELRLEQGREEEAKAHFEICVNTFKDHEFTTLPLLHIETLLHLTSIYARHGQLEEARRMSEWAKRLAETLKSDAGLAMASQAEASLLLATGDRKGAEEAYLKSLGHWEKAGWPYYHAKALIAYSEAIAQTNSEESRKGLEQGAEIFKKLGAKRDLEKAQAKLSG